MRKGTCSSHLAVCILSAFTTLCLELIDAQYFGWVLLWVLSLSLSKETDALFGYVPSDSLICLGEARHILYFETIWLQQPAFYSS